MKLPLEALHIVLGDDLGMNVVLYGVILRGKPEGVPSHRIQNVIALHPALACHDIQRRIGSGMTHMEPLS